MKVDVSDIYPPVAAQALERARKSKSGYMVAVNLPTRLSYRWSTGSRAVWKDADGLRRVATVLDVCRTVNADYEKEIGDGG